MISFVGITRSHGRNVYVMNEDGSDLRPISTAFTRVGVYPTVAHQPVWSPDGRFLMFTVLNGQLPTSTVYIANLNQGDIQRVAAPYEFSEGLAWLSDGRILCSSLTQNSGLLRYAIYPDGSHREDFLKGSEDHIRHFFAPGGEYVAKLNGRDSSIVVQDLRGLQEHTVVEKSRSDRRNLQWSPDGRRIAFSESGGFSLKEKLYVVERDGSNLHAVGRIASESGFDWAPAADKIAGTTPHLKAHQRSFTLDVITIDPPKQYPITVVTRSPESGDFSPTTPAWSPDGRHLAYNTYGDNFETLNKITLVDKIPQCLVAEAANLTGIHSITWAG